MSAKIVIAFALVALLAVQSFGRRVTNEERERDHGHEEREEKMLFEHERHRNASCTAPVISQPDTPPCTTCICYPDNVLNCWTLKPRFCNPTTSTTTTTTTTTSAPSS